MCRFLGYLSEPDLAPPDGLFDSFAELAWSGRVGPQEAPGHDDGWGLWARTADEVVWLRRASSLKDDIDEFTAIGRRLNKQRPRVLLLHLRKTSGAALSRENSQPFVLDGLAFCHNGTVFDAESLPTRLAPAGGTDSERMFLLIAERVSESGLMAGVQDALLTLRDFSWTALNFVLSDGERLVACRSFDVGRNFLDVRSRYYELYVGCGRHGIAVSNQPLAVDGFSWQPLENGELLVVEGSRIDRVRL